MPYKMTYDWSAVQKYYDEGHNQRETIRYFGMTHASWWKARKVGRIKTEDRRLSYSELFSRSKNSRQHLKQRMFKDGLLEKKCYGCGLIDWLDKPISLELHHKDGDCNNWKQENLELLCPNCHSQTESFGGRNRKFKTNLLPSGAIGSADGSEP